MAGTNAAATPLPTDNTSIENILNSDTSLLEIAARFEHEVTLEPDADLHVDSADSTPRDSDTASNSSSLKDIDDVSSDDSSKEKLRATNGDVKNMIKKTPSSIQETADKEKSHLKTEELRVMNSEIIRDSEGPTKASSDTESVGSKKSRSKNPLKMLKKLTKFNKSGKKSSFSSAFSTAVVDTLPQAFVAKYLGHREITGVSGLHHVRKPVDEMIQEVRSKIDAKEQVTLPLLYVVVTANGLDLREHQSNRVKEAAPLGLIPIDFISYGVQDIKYWKVFTCIVVRTLSWQSRSATCHAFLCDSPHSGRRMALALGAAFNMYAKKLKADGKRHNFQVELRPPDELAEAIAECEA